MGVSISLISIPKVILRLGLQSLKGASGFAQMT